MDYWATDEVTDILKQHIGCRSLREMYERLQIDTVIGVEPEYVGPTIPEYADVFGCRYRNVEYGTSVYREYVHHPFNYYESIEEIERGYILAPCHNIQPITPLRNILVMYDEGYKRGKPK